MEFDGRRMLVPRHRSRVYGRMPARSATPRNIAGWFEILHPARGRGSQRYRTWFRCLSRGIELADPHFVTALRTKRAELAGAVEHGGS
jgi:hypothetical protein